MKPPVQINTVEEFQKLIDALTTRGWNKGFRWGILAGVLVTLFVWSMTTPGWFKI